MFETVAEEMERLVACLRPALMHSLDAAAELEHVARIERLTGAAKMLLAQRASDSGKWAASGSKSPAEWLARTFGSSVGDARETLETSERIGELPSTEKALRKGELSRAQAALVADAATADPDCEKAMLERAAHDSVAGLRAERDRIKAAACPDPDARYESIRKGRYLRTFTDSEGAGCGQWRTTPDMQAEIKALLKPFQDEVFSKAREAGAHEPSEAYAIDALVEMARASAAGGAASASKRRAPGKVIVRVDHEALVRGHTQNGETSDIVGVGPVPISLVREMMATGDVFLSALLTKGKDVATVAHLGRRPTAFQQTALQWLDTTCRVEGCYRPVAQWDHRGGWAKTHRTLLSDMQGLCDHDHDLKSYRGYRVAPSPIPGKIRLIPPDDPDPP